jgi:branched-chain amino acid transport system ATP-binding protein
VTALLQTRGLSCRFGGLQALSEVAFDVEEGTIVGLIGPNGAGKTTFINSVTGFVKPSGGTVTIGGRDLTAARPWKIAHAGVARTFQIVKPFRAMTVRENVAVGSMFGPEGSRSVGQALDGADAILERVDMLDRAGSPPGELTIADMKRLELAKALAMKPKLLLLDEVMAGLRPQEIDKSVELIKSLRDGGLTIIAVEHVMKAIMAISDVVFVLHEGKELARGTPKEVASDDRVIEAYLGKRYAEREGRNGDARS